MKADLLKWMLGALIAQGGLVIALVKLLYAASAAGDPPIPALRGYGPSIRAWRGVTP